MGERKMIRLRVLETTIKILLLMSFISLPLAMACSHAFKKSRDLVIIPEEEMKLCFSEKDKFLLVDQISTWLNNKQVKKKLYLTSYRQSLCKGLFIVEGYLETENVKVRFPVLKFDTSMAVNTYAFNGKYDSKIDSLAMNEKIDLFLTKYTNFGQEEKSDIIQTFQLGVHYVSRVRIHYEY